MKPNHKMKLLKMLPKPDELKGLMPRMRQPAMLAALLSEDTAKIADITLIALLMGTINQLMNEHEDWEEFLDVSDFQNGEFNEDEIPEPCGDPECEGCKELEAAIKHAKDTGATIKSVRLTKAQAIEMGFIDNDGNELDRSKSREAISCSNGTTSKVIH